MLIHAAGGSGRYGRIGLIGALSIEALREASICVAGAGALGNEVLKNLVLYGPRKLTVIDNDRVEESNLGRCFLFSESDAERGAPKAETAVGRLRQINGEVPLQAVASDLRDLDHSFYSSFDIVLGCVDNIAARLHLNSNCYYRGVPYIDGGLDGLRGRVQVVLPPDSACYQCTVNASHMAALDRLYTCDGRVANVPRRIIGTEPCVASLVGSMQSLEAVKVLSGRGKGGVVHLYDGIRNALQSISVDIDCGCDNHGGGTS